MCGVRGGGKMLEVVGLLALLLVSSLALSSSRPSEEPRCLGDTVQVSAALEKGSGPPSGHSTCTNDPNTGGGGGVACPNHPGHTTCN
ncbi:hypothetical protein BHM03_00043480 [Ensete ventricosum]|nr:hypothetical protein BHM03_00043480 [Ensete ventricosum]